MSKDYKTLYDQEKKLRENFEKRIDQLQKFAGKLSGPYRGFGRDNIDRVGTVAILRKIAFGQPVDLRTPWEKLRNHA